MNFMGRVTLDALTLNVTTQASVDRIILQKEAMLANPSVGVMRKRDAAMTPGAESLALMTAVAGVPADTYGGFAVGRRPGLPVGINDRFMAFGA